MRFVSANNNVGNKTKPTSKSLNLQFCWPRHSSVDSADCFVLVSFGPKISFWLRENDGRADTQSILFIAHQIDETNGEKEWERKIEKILLKKLTSKNIMEKNFRLKERAQHCSECVCLCESCALKENNFWSFHLMLALSSLSSMLMMNDMARRMSRTRTVLAKAIKPSYKPRHSRSCYNIL